MFLDICLCGWFGVLEGGLYKSRAWRMWPHTGRVGMWPHTGRVVQDVCVAGLEFWREGCIRAKHGACGLCVRPKMP